MGNRLLSEERIERERARWTQGGERRKADGRRRGITIIVISIWDMKQGAKSITSNERNRSYLLEI